MNKGKKIRQLREDAGLTQAQLAKAGGVTEPAIRSYESGGSAPRPKPLAALSQALGVVPDAIVDHKLDSPVAAMQALFELEDGDAAARPVGTVGGAAVRFGGDIATYVEQWLSMRERLDDGTLSREEYVRWRDRLGLGGDE